MQLADARRVRGISRALLAEEAGIGLSTVQKIENGERQGTTLPVLMALAKALDARITITAGEVDIELL